MSNPEKSQNPEKLNKSIIRQITFVIPAYNESENLKSLTHNLNSLSIPEGVNLRIILSDNGSTDKTREAAESSHVAGEPLVVETRSIPKSIGSARRKGIERAIDTFHNEGISAKASEHILVNFDADTLVSYIEFLKAIQEIFSDPKIMVAYGPIDWISKEGKIDRKYRMAQDLLSKLRLKRLFNAQGRLVSHYINEPRTIFAGACTVIRESVLINEVSLI